MHLRLSVMVATVFLCLSYQAHGDKVKSLEILRDWKGAYSGQDEAKRVVATTVEEWQKIWDATHKRVTPKPELPKVDFEKEMVLAVFMGERRTGGYEIGISKVEASKKGLEVYVKEISPPEGSDVTMAITAPYFIAVVPKVKVAVHFRDDR